MATGPFTRPTLEPAAPFWIVRALPRAGGRDVEIIFVGHANRAELESQIERLARWPWHLDDVGGAVSILGDSRGEPIGIRVTRSTWTPADIREQVFSLFGDLVEQAFDIQHARFFTKPIQPR